MMTWRNAAVVFAVLCGIQRWQSCTRTDSTRLVEHTRTESLPAKLIHSFDPPAESKPAPTATRTFFGVKPPAWVQRLLPQPGEKIRDYENRIIPIAQLAIAPQRARVARMRDQLDETKQTELDTAVTDAATAIEARVTEAFLKGEFQTIKPMTEVTMARDLLDIVDKANTKFTSTLTPEQAKRFDFADYLAFSTKWEDALPR